jgi:uncharacterized protein (TIGR03067 family)
MLSPAPAMVLSERNAMKRQLLFPLALAALIIAVNNGVTAQAKDDKALLQGMWKVTSAEEEGKANKELADAQFTFKDDKLSLVLKSGEKNDLPFKLDPAQNPKTIDLQRADAKDQALGIYELEGDVLKLCVADPGHKRPTEFKAKDKNVVLVVLKREK